MVVAAPVAAGVVVVVAVGRISRIASEVAFVKAGGGEEGEGEEGKEGGPVRYINSVLNNRASLSAACIYTC
jgi:hypothetical protein